MSEKFAPLEIGGSVVVTASRYPSPVIVDLVNESTRRIDASEPDVVFDNLRAAGRVARFDASRSQSRTSPIARSGIRTFSISCSVNFEPGLKAIQP